MTTTPPSKPEHQRRGHRRLTLEEVYRPLVDGLAGVSVESAPAVLAVRCGLNTGKGKRQRCGALIGEVVAAPAGLAWRPANPRPERTAPGYVPFLLPASSPEDRQHFCETFDSTCRAGHGWVLAVSELRARLKKGKNVKAPYYVTRAIPDEWGPLVNDPAHWTAEELLGAVRGLVARAAGQWPPAGLTGVQESQLSNRVDTLTDVMNGTGPYIDRQPMVQAALERLLGEIPSDGTPIR